MKYGWWWISTGTTEVTLLSPSVQNKKPRTPWSNSIIMKLGTKGQSVKKKNFLRLQCPANCTKFSNLALGTVVSWVSVQAWTIAAYLWEVSPKPRRKKRSWLKWRRWRMVWWRWSFIPVPPTRARTEALLLWSTKAIVLQPWPGGNSYQVKIKNTHLLLCIIH